jgi:hypothetical protein
MFGGFEIWCMDAKEGIIHGDGWFWHLSNIIVGVAILLGTVLYAPPGSYSLNLLTVSVDPFYFVAPLSVLYTYWCVLDLRRWCRGDDIV